MKYPMTPRGYSRMREELQKLKGMRPELARAIEVARAHGDLSENADYDAAKEHSGMVEAKIRDLEAKLLLAEVIDPRKISSTDRVVFGLSATIVDLDSDETKTITIVGADESDVDNGLISFESPLAKAMIGKELDDVVTLRLPAGAKEFEITEIFVDYKEEG